MNPEEVSEAIHSIPQSKLLKFTNLFIDYVDNENLNELYEIIKIDKKPDENLCKNLVNDAKRNQKLFHWISVLLQL